MAQDLHPERSLAPFLANGTLKRIVSRQSSGKEATVYCCESGERLGEGQLVAAKIYRPPERRAFKRHMEYADGRFVQGRTKRQAIASRSRVGRRILFHEWIAYEHWTLWRLWRAGVRVPRPIAVHDYCILMEYLGSTEAPAPHLRNVALDRDTCAWVFAELLADIERMLAIDVIHGDLSAYNVLFWEGVPWIIDVPQALDPRGNRRAAEILARDIRHVSEWAATLGVPSDPETLSTELWVRWLRAEL